MSDTQTMVVKSLIEKYTLPQLKSWQHKLPPNLADYCLSFVPTYSFAFQATCVNVKQKSKEWLMAREKLITCSNFGVVTGTNKYTKADDFLKQWIWRIPTHSNTAMEWGTQHEPVARNLYIDFLSKHSPFPPQTDQPRSMTTSLERLINEVYHHSKTYQHNDVEVIELGICIDEQHPWCGGSPDGIVCQYNAFLKRWVVIGLLEIKCPVSKRFYNGIPPMYMDQIQGFMNMFDIPWCHFMTWTPNQFKLEYVARNADYWTTVVFPKLERFYYGRCLPAQILRENNMLTFGFVTPVFDWNEIEPTQSSSIAGPTQSSNRRLRPVFLAGTTSSSSSASSTSSPSSSTPSTSSSSVGS